MVVVERPEEEAPRVGRPDKKAPRAKRTDEEVSGVEGLEEKAPKVGELGEKAPGAGKPGEEVPETLSIIATATASRFRHCFSIFCCLIFSQGLSTSLLLLSIALILALILIPSSQLQVS